MSSHKIVLILLFLLSFLSNNFVFSQSSLNQLAISSSERRSFDERIHSLSMFVDAFNAHVSSQQAEKYLLNLFALHKISRNPSNQYSMQVFELIHQTLEENVSIQSFGPDLLAQVSVKGKYKEKKVHFDLFLRKEKQEEFFYWAIEAVHGAEFLLPTPQTGSKSLAPNSSDMNFIDLAKHLNGHNNGFAFTRMEYEPDYLSLMLYACAEGNLILERVEEVKLIFLSVPGWAFVVKESESVNRNSGWRIHDLFPIPNKDSFLEAIDIR